MNHEHDHEDRLQAQAVEHERSNATARTDHPEVDAYRLVHRIARSAPMPDMPADFVTRVARHVRTSEQIHPAMTDVWLIWPALACIAIAGIVFALPILLGSVQASMALAGDVPWPMLAVAGLSLLLVAGTDALLSQRRLRSR